MHKFFHIFVILFLILRTLGSAPPRGECLTDRNCSASHKCVHRHCFHRNEHVFKCSSDLTCPDFHVCRHNVCLMEKARKKMRRHLKVVREEYTK